jgi:hypothetical protein
LAAVLVLVTALGGCARPQVVNSDLGVAGDAARGGPYGVPCDASSGVATTSLPPEQPLTDGATLTLATRCILTTERVPGDGEWSVRQDQQATTGLDALAAALRLPSQENTAALPCPLIGYAPIVITVTEDGGRRFRPRIPHQACGAPRTEVTDAITALPWTTTTSTRLAQARTELEVTSGCSGMRKPIIAMMAPQGPGRTQRSTVDATARQLRVCRYKVGDAEMGLVGGVMLHAGVLVGASTLQPDQAQQLLAAVEAAPPAGPCATPESPFAEIDDNTLELTVELGGCYRALAAVDNGLRQLDGALVTRLLG